MGQAGQAAGRKRRPARTGVGGGLTPTWWGQEPGSELERRPLPPPLLSGTVHDPPASGVQCLRGFRVAQGSQIGMNVPHSSQQAPHAVSIPRPPGSRRQLPAPTHRSVSPSSPSLLCTPAGSAREAARGRKEPERLSEGLLLQKKTRKLDGSWKNQKDEGPWEETARQPSPAPLGPAPRLVMRPHLGQEALAQVPSAAVEPLQEKTDRRQDGLRPLSTFGREQNMGVTEA